MYVAVTILCVAVLLAAATIRNARERKELERSSITPEALHALMAARAEVQVIDVRLPLDLLGDSATIPGAKWIDPRQIREHPWLIPGDRDVVVYCTCPSEKTSRTILHRARALGFLRVKFLRGGLQGWRAKGYAVEPYDKPFQLDAGRSNRLETAGSSVSD